MIIVTIISTVAVFFSTTYINTHMSLLQVHAPDFLGRVKTTFRFSIWGTMPISSLITEWLTDAIGTTNTLIWIRTISLTPAEKSMRPRSRRQQ